MSRDDEFAIIQIENLWEDSYNSPGVLDVWLLIYKYIKNKCGVLLSSFALVWLRSKNSSSWLKLLLCRALL